MPTRVEMRDFVSRRFHLTLRLYLGDASRVARPLPVAAVPDMSLIPFAPFENLGSKISARGFAQKPGAAKSPPKSNTEAARN